MRLVEFNSGDSRVYLVPEQVAYLIDVDGGATRVAFVGGGDTLVLQEPAEQVGLKLQGRGPRQM